MNKVCFVIPSLQAGGMERVMSELCYYFVGKPNIEIHLILYSRNREIFYKIPDEIIVHKPKFKFNNKNRLFSTLRTISFLRNKIKDINPDSILSFGEYWNNFVLLALFGLKYPIFVSDRSQPDKSLGVIHDKLRNWLYPRATGIIAQTHKAKDIYYSFYYHPNISVIGNPIREISRDENQIDRKNIVLSVGRLIKSKHHDTLIRLFAQINKQDWKLVIVGYDHLKQKNMVRLKKLIKDLGVEDRVILAGKQRQIERFYLQSKIFAFTSSSEGFPNVIGEAMSSGIPVVSFDCVAGPSDMIEDGINGFLAPLFDYDQFREKLSLLMDNESLREQMGKNAEESIRKYAPDIIGERYYKFILNRHKRREKIDANNLKQPA